MVLEHPFDFYVSCAKKLGIPQTDLIYKITITSYKDPILEWGDDEKRIKIFHYHCPQILFNSMQNEDGQELIAGSLLVLEREAVLGLDNMCSVGKILSEEYLFALSGKDYSKIIVQNSRIKKVQVFLKDCRKEFFEIGRDYQDALEDMVKIYDKKRKHRNAIYQS